MPSLKSLAWMLMVLLCSTAMAHAQSREEYPLKGKRVAVYFSKKHFNFDDNYRIPLSQFIKSDQGDKAEIEDIKLQTLVALGTLFSHQLKAATQADSVFFLNEFPQLASAFIGKYGSDDHALEALGSAFDSVDYVLVVNPFILGSYKTSSVYSRSNRIITEQVVVKTGRIRMELFEPQSGARRHVFESCIDERKTPVKEILFEFHMEASRTGQFLAKLFSLAVQNMNTGVENNCEHN
jgi:hypothetical protein